MRAAAAPVLPPPPLGEGRGGGLQPCLLEHGVSLLAPSPTLPQRGREFEDGGR
jgi:hypothetical protein